MCRTHGFTLIELMIAVAIVAIISAFAIPAYNGYVRESRLSAMRMNLDTLRIAVEAYRLDHAAGTYGSKTTYDKAVISSSYGWTPEGDNAAYSYGVVAAATTYTICSASSAKASVRCRKAGGQYTCTDGTATTASAACN